MSSVRKRSGLGILDHCSFFYRYKEHWYLLVGNELITDGRNILMMNGRG